VTETLREFRIADTIAGIGVSVVLSVSLGAVYFAVLHEPGPAFYPFAGLIFVGGPLIAGVISIRRSHEKRLRTFLISAAASFSISFALFLVMYAVLPQFDRTSVRLPASCDGYDAGIDPPADLIYSLPGIGDGILVASDARSALITVIDTSQPPFPSTVYLASKGDGAILVALGFPDDNISAAIVEDTLILFNDKLGALLDAHTGEYQQRFLTIDNYGGLSETDRPIISRASDGHWYFETTAVISNWNTDGTVVSRRHMAFKGIARGCFISGDTGEIIDLSP
jgi:hypothetical protein